MSGGGVPSVSAPRWASSRPTEFEVQAYLYWKLRELGLRVRGEVSAPVDRIPISLRKDGKKRKTKVRFDLVVLNDRDELTRIVEVKAARVSHGLGGWQGTRQGARYQSFGVPVDIVYGIEGANELLCRLTAAMAASGAQM